MIVFVRAFLILMMALGLATMTGCASSRTIDASSTESIIAGVNKGDYVRVTTKTDVAHKFVITKITNKALYGDNERIVYEDMQKVEVLKGGPKKEKGGFWSRLF